MKNKRGQGLSTNAIILIILGVVVLVVMILGFTMGWGTLFPFFSGNNVEQIKTNCGIACSTENVYDFCTQERTLKADGLPGGVKEVKGTCFYFSTKNEFVQYGIAKCPQLESRCPQPTS